MLNAFHKMARNLRFTYQGGSAVPVVKQLHDWAASKTMSGTSGASGKAWCDKVVMLYREGDTYVVEWITTDNDYGVLSDNWESLVHPQNFEGGDKLLPVDGAWCLPAMSGAKLAASQSTTVARCSPRTQPAGLNGRVVPAQTI